MVQFLNIFSIFFSFYTLHVLTLETNKAASVEHKAHFSWDKEWENKCKNQYQLSQQHSIASNHFCHFRNIFFYVALTIIAQSQRENKFQYDNCVTMSKASAHFSDSVISEVDALSCAMQWVYLVPVTDRLGLAITPFGFSLIVS